MSTLSYDSVKYIKVHNTLLALIYYALMFLIFLYIVIFQVVLEQGYQRFDSVVSSNMLKVKGSAVTKDNATVWDSYDAVQPPVLPDAVFVATNFVKTPDQNRGICPDKSKADCSLCEAGKSTEFGVMTGDCDGDNHCLLRGWCPFEEDPAPGTDSNFLMGVDEWTLFARVSASFPAFDVRTSNTDGMTEAEPNGQALFYLSHIVESAGYQWEEIQESGGVFLGDFKYDCNFNKAVSLCQPEVSFSRIDDPENRFSAGFNFRYTDHVAPGTRELTKLFGVYIVFRTSGQGGGFSFAALGTTIGAGLGFLAIASIICDFIMQYALPQREQYERAKFQPVQESGLIGTPFVAGERSRLPSIPFRTTDLSARNTMGVNEEEKALK